MKLQRKELPRMLLCEVSLGLEFLFRGRRGHGEPYSKVHSVFKKKYFYQWISSVVSALLGSHFIPYIDDSGKITYKDEAQKNNRFTDFRTVTGRTLLWEGRFPFSVGHLFSQMPGVSALLLQWEYCIFISPRFNAMVPTKRGLVGSAKPPEQVGPCLTCCKHLNTVG